MISNAEQPVLVLVAGPNGSGKSSAYQNAEFRFSGRSAWIINPDLLAARISQVERLELHQANIQAVQRIENWLGASIQSIVPASC